MFELPQGEPVEETADLSVGAMQMPFDYGVISHYSGRRKTPIGHRLVCDGLVVGWLAEGSERNIFVAGNAARAKLMQVANSAKIRSTASQWRRTDLATVIAKIPEAFPDTTKLGALMPGSADIYTLDPADLAALAIDLAHRASVFGALAFEDGMVIESSGELPCSPKDLATMAQEQLNHFDAMRSDLGLGTLLRTSMWLDDGVLLLVGAGTATLGLWVKHSADHQSIISNAVALVEAGRQSTEVSSDEPLPEGFILRQSKGGVDKCISLLTTAKDARTSGFLRASKGEVEIELVIKDGVPVGMRAAEGADLANTIYEFSGSGMALDLHRLERAGVLAALAGSMQGWSLGKFCDEMTTGRAKSESRRAVLARRLDKLFGFPAAIEALTSSRAKWTLDESAQVGSSNLIPITTAASVLRPIDNTLGNALAKAEKDLNVSNKIISRLERKSTASVKIAESSQDELRLANDRIAELRASIEGLNADVDGLQARIREEEMEQTEANERSSKLSKRVTFLEHQLSERAAELAKTIGDADSSEDLRKNLEEMIEKEVSLNSELAAGAERLTTIRDQLEADERRQRLLSEQVAVMRDRHRQVQAETQEVEIHLAERRDEITSLEEEAHSSRKLMLDHETRSHQSEVRSGQAQTEIRELMEERRTVLRELGDMGARRGQAEAELRSLIEQCEELREAHEEALDDIDEAEVIRARMNQEPLAMALLGEEDSFKALGPVLERLEHARSLGYSVTLLDRAVERGLAVIQHTVEHVAKTPRYLLSNEVMELLERQSPETAGTVRGLTRWSVQQRLEHRLGETVSHVVLDLELLLEDFEMSITMLRRLRQVLDNLETLGVPSEELATLRQATNKPESLPQISLGARGMIRRALDDIYMEADLRDAGMAVRLEQTTKVLEELIDQIDSTGLSSGTPKGPLWDFQRSGMLPHEMHDGATQVAVPLDALEDMNREIGALPGIESYTASADDVAATTATTTSDESDDSDLSQKEVIAVAHVERVSDSPIWEEMPEPEDDPRPDAPMVATTPLVTADMLPSGDEHDERAALEQELARLDVEWERRSGTREGGGSAGSDSTTADDAGLETSASASALADLESELTDLEI
mgnify:FL=1